MIDILYNIAMKIAFVVWRFPVISETFILNQISGLMDLGHEVDIFSFTKGDTRKMHSDVRKYGMLARTSYSFAFFDRILRAPLVLSKMLFRNSGLAIRSLNFFRFGRKAVSLAVLFRASLVAGKGPYDIIHCQYGTVALGFLPLHHLRLLGGKFIVHFRGHDITGFVNQRGDRVYQKLFREADYFLSVCDYFQKLAVKLGCPEDKISVLRSGIDCEQFTFLERKMPVKGDVKIAFVGRLVEEKGIEYAIQAVAILKHRGYHVKLMIVGDGPLKQSLSHLCQNLTIESHVRFFGAKNQEEIIKILNTAHLFTAPSVTARTGTQEGIPNVLKEAMAMGLPVVSTYHAGIPELVQDGVSGFLVPERDALALADKLGYLIDHPKHWSEMGRAGRIYIEKNYEKKALNRQLVDIYSRVLRSQ